MEDNNMQKIVLNGTEAWTLSGNENYFYNTNSIYPKSADGSTLVNSYCNYYPKEIYNDIYNGISDYGFGFAYNNSGFFSACSCNSFQACSGFAFVPVPESR